MFSEWFIALLIYGSISLTALGVVVLLRMLYKDFSENKLW